MKATISALVALGMLISSAASADSLVIHLNSHHSHDAYRYNESNPGVGYRWAETLYGHDVHAEAGLFRNSYYRMSSYLIVSKPIAQLGGIKVSLDAGVATGYSDRPGRGELRPIARIAFHDLYTGLIAGFSPTVTESENDIEFVAMVSWIVDL